MGTYRIQRVTEDAWGRWRDLRLEMLADTPLAYLESYEQALGHDEAEWRFQARRASGAEGPSVLFVAVDDADGRWVATMGAYESYPGITVLVSVYVAPPWRGQATGVADALVAACVAWSRDRDARVMRLLVHEHNPRAIAFYARKGFVPTGYREPYLLDPRHDEVEMELPLL